MLRLGLLFYYFKRRPKAVKPPKLRITAEPTELLADGKSKSKITIQLLDKKGEPVAASADTEIKLTTTGGKIESEVVKIPKEKEAGKTVLVSSTESGKIKVSTEARGLESIAIMLEFKEKPRFCMGCGAKMSVKDKICKECRASPDKFTGPARVCRNCERRGKTTYLPSTAEFCSDCGASQPKQER